MTDCGRAGYKAIVGGAGSDPLARHMKSRRPSDDFALDCFEFGSSSLRQPEPLPSCVMGCRRDDVAIERSRRDVRGFAAGGQR